MIYTFEQYGCLLPHLMEEVCECIGGELILKCSDCDRVMRWNFKDMPVTLVQGEMVSVDMRGSQQALPYPHTFCRGGLRIGPVTVK